MPSVVDQLNTMITNYTAALVADSVSPQPNYQIEGISVSQNEWREHLQKLVDGLTASVNARAPFCVVSRKVL